MKIREVLDATQPATVAPAPADPTDPTAQQMAQGQQLLGTIDPSVTPPQEATNKLTGWLKQYPWLDRVTDLLPATRVIKAAAAAIDAIQAGDPKSAIAALAGAGGRALQTANTAVSTGSALAQGDVQGAALAAGGQVGKLAQAATVTQNLAQNNLAGAAQAVGGNTAKVANVAQKVQQYAPQAQAAVQTALAPQQPVTESLERIKRLSGL